MINKQIFALIVLAAMLVLAGCQVATDSSPKPNIVIMLTPIQRTEKSPQVIHPTPIPSLSVMSLQNLTETVKPTIVATSDLPLTARPIDHCLQIQPHLPPDADIKGMAILDDYFLDLKSGQQTLITNDPDAQIGVVDVSPDGRQLAYTLLEAPDASGNRQMNLVISNVERGFKVIPWKEKWAYWVGWSGNDPFVFKVYEQVSSVSVFDLSTLSEKELILDDPRIWKYDAPMAPGGQRYSDDRYIVVEYDPMLTRVVYFRYGEKGNIVTVLRDLDTGNILVKLPNDFTPRPTFGIDAGVPRWDSDSEQFLLEGGEGDIRELYNVTRNGLVTQLTYLTNVFGYAHVRGYSRSWDKRYIAFWYWAQSYESYRLAVLNATTGEITDFCISEGIEYYRSWPSTPIWSPDSHQFIVDVLQADEVNTKPVISVDVDQGFAVQIAEDMSPMGWMVSP
jgi:hypothetical protein